MEIEPEPSSFNDEVGKKGKREDDQENDQEMIASKTNYRNEDRPVNKRVIDDDDDDYEDEEEDEERKIDEEYIVWKKNAPYLYDLVMTHALEWPSLTVEWLPDARYLKGHYCTEQRLIAGTHTNGAEPNYLMVVHARLPFSGDIVESNRSSIKTSSTNVSEEKEFTMAKCKNGVAYYESGNGGGSGGSGSILQYGNVEERIKVIQKIYHPSEVNRARYMPQNPSIIASKGTESQVYVFDITKHPSEPDSKRNRPDLCLVGHEKEGYGLDWSPCKGGYIASGSDDGLVCIWDISAVKESDKVDAKSVLKFHSNIVEDVAWHRTQPNILGSVSDDRKIAIWDDRNTNIPVTTISDPHGKKEVNTISFNPFNPFVFATGGSDSNVALWDSRSTKAPLHVLKSHSAEVYQVQWSYVNETILASSGNDRRVMVWDVSRIGAQQSQEDALEGPPELMFVHGGHTSRVTEFSWNPNDPWVVASVADDNILQVWQMAEPIYSFVNGK